MFHNGHELNVGEMKLRTMRGDEGREFAIRQHLLGVRGVALPRAEMHLVNGQRLIAAMALGAVAHPEVIGPLI